MQYFITVTVKIKILVQTGASFLETCLKQVLVICCNIESLSTKHKDHISYCLQCNIQYCHISSTIVSKVNAFSVNFRNVSVSCRLTLCLQNKRYLKVVLLLTHNYSQQDYTNLIIILIVSHKNRFRISFWGVMSYRSVENVIKIIIGSLKFYCSIT